MNLTNRQRNMMMVPLMLGGFIALLNETLLNVAFPQLMAGLNVPMSTVQWLATAYVLVVGVLVPTVAFLLKTFSTKKLYLAAMLVFTLGTVSAGLAGSFPVLLVSRVIQGAGTGILIPIMMNTILAIYPTEKRGIAMGVGTMVIVCAPGIGPVLSGLVLQHLSWHWLFFMVIPVALIAIICGALTLKNTTEITRPKIDYLSLLLSSIGFGGLIFGISSFESMGFRTLTVPLALACGLVGLFLFGRRQLSLKQPMLNIRVFRYPMFTLGVGILFISAMLPFAVNIILPTYMQSAMGLLPFAAGLALLPGNICNVVFSPIFGMLFDKIGVKPLAIAGYIIMTVVMFFLSRISATVGLAVVILCHCGMNLAFSLIITPMQTNAVNQLPQSHNADGIALLNTNHQIAAAFGSSLFIGLMGSIQARQLAGYTAPDSQQQIAAMVAGARVSFTAALILVAIGLILTFFVRRRAKYPYRMEKEEKYYGS